LYAYIKGTLAYRHDDYIVVEAYGVGYKISTSLSTIEVAGAEGSEIKVFTHLYVREDTQSLYGFATQEELGMFELLLGVLGVGPKAALSLISALSPSKFGLAVITDDAKSLTRAQGIGGKTAQRIILELKDKIKKEQLAQASGSSVVRQASEDRGESKVSEAVSALMVLGYSPAEASRAVASVYSDAMDLETIIKSSLKNLVR